MTAAPTYPNSSLRGSVVSAIWVWLRACFSCFGRADIYRQGDDNPVMSRTGRNRAERHIQRHFTNGPETRALPPVRNLAPFIRFGARGVSPTQFMERRCRLSCMGRCEIYRIPYYTSRMQREAVLARFDLGYVRVPHGLWRAHIWPS